MENYSDKFHICTPLLKKILVTCSGLRIPLDPLSLSHPRRGPHSCNVHVFHAVRSETRTVYSWNEKGPATMCGGAVGERMHVFVVGFFIRILCPLFPFHQHGSHEWVFIFFTTTITIARRTDSWSVSVFVLMTKPNECYRRSNIGKKYATRTKKTQTIYTRNIDKLCFITKTSKYVFIFFCFCS